MKIPKLIMKFGGTSMATLAHIRRAAAHVQRERKAGYQVAVVVSAMGHETDRLASLAQKLMRSRADMPARLEQDAILASGEQASAGLLALALQALGLPARSWLGWQLPLRTGRNGRAKIEHLRVRALAASLKAGETAVVAGFQGVDADGRISTLGRGGSDISAAALAHALKAERCDIYTDVDGVYTTDPGLVRGARRLTALAHEEMLELASQGAQVLQTRAVGFAMAYNVPLRVCSSFLAPDAPRHSRAGTLVCSEEQIMEKSLVSGIASSRAEAKLTLRDVPDRPGVAAGVFGALAKADINVDMIVQNIGLDDGLTDMTFTVARADCARAVRLVEAQKKRLGYRELAVSRAVAKVSVVGIGMRAHAGVAQKMFAVLAREKINIQVISTSEIKVSVLIAAAEAKRAVQALHKAYRLDQKPRQRR